MAKPQLSNYTIVIFCPLAIEQQAAYLMLDEVHHGPLARRVGQTVLYTLGRIASYNAAIAGYPEGEVGLGVSGSMVSEVLRDFLNLEFGFLVGIAAGLPSATRDIRLGDIAVAVPNNDSPGVVGYDLVKVEEGDIKIKQWQNATHPLLRSAISNIRMHQDRPEHSFTRHLKVLEMGLPAFRRPNSPCTSSEFWTCQNKVYREEGEDIPRVHYGTIISGNGVIKSKKRRDELRDKFNGIAIEMEAAGMTTRLPVAVIRGISDFADSNKQDKWHPYAAIAAAAYAKEILLRLGPLETAPDSFSIVRSDIATALAIAMPERRCFVGREEELAILDEFLTSSPHPALGKKTMALWGLSGVGKSQLVAEAVKRKLREACQPEVFWVTGESKEAFERSILTYLKVDQCQTNAATGDLEDYHSKRTQLVKAFFSMLRTRPSTHFIMVIDSISGASSLPTYIKDYLDDFILGSVILVTKSKDIARQFHPRIEVKGLPEPDSVKLLRLEIDGPVCGSDREMDDLCQMLKCHPLSLRLAASVITQSSLSVAQYIDKWRMRQLDEENMKVDITLRRSFAMNFEALQNTDPVTAKLLTLFGFLDPRDMWQELCLGELDDRHPAWLHDISRSQSLSRHYASMHNLSFIEAKPCNHGNGFVHEIHPAIHGLARQNAGMNEVEYVKCAVSLVAAKVPRSNEKNFLKIVKRLEPHAEQCQIYMTQDRGGGNVDLVELEKFANLFRHLGRYDEALRLYKINLRALSMDQPPSQDTMKMMAGIENNMGLVYHSQRKYEMAIGLYQSSHGRQMLLNFTDKSASMTTVYNAARSLMLLGKLDDSLRSLSIASSYFAEKAQHRHGDNDKKGDIWPIYFRILNDIGEVHLRQGRVDEAEENFKRAFEGHKHCLDELHPNVFAVRLNIGRVYVERFRFGAAKRIFDYIISMYTEWWGKCYSETMRAIAELAELHLRHGEMKHLMGDGGEQELEMATHLWDEVLSFHRDLDGSNPDNVLWASSKLQKLRLHKAAAPDDSYQIYC